MSDVSLYIPCYNASRFLDKVLPAVCEQTLVPREIVIVDDGSTDATPLLARAHADAAPCPMRVVAHPHNMGLAAARNTGVRETAGKRVASLDADVVPAPDWLERLNAEMEATGAAGVGGDLMETCCDGLANLWRCRHMRQSWGPERKERPPFLFGSNTLFTRQAIQAAGGYDERLRTNAEDVKLCEAIRDRMLLVYTPAAKCSHLRKDSLASLLHAYWRWHYYGTHTPVSVSKNVESHWKAIKRLGRLFREDLAEGQPDCAAMDLLHMGYGAYMDWRQLMAGWRNGNAAH